MKNNLTTAVGAVSLLLFSFALPGDQVRFAVKEKTKVAKVFEDSATFHSTGMSMTVDGEDVGEGAPDFKLTFTEHSRVEVTDEYLSLKDGKPGKLKRTYDKLSGKSTQHVDLPEGAEAHGADTDTTKERTSELEGQTVVFTLDDAGEEYKADFEDGKGDAELLKDLEEDMDLRGFLPEGSVSEDKSWEIEAKRFHGALGNPGGDLKLDAEGDEDDSDMDQQFEDNLKGKGKGTYKGTREVDGKTCAVIALEAELETEGKQDKSEEGGHNGVMTLTLALEVEGELLWDVEAGRFHSCTLTSRIKMAMKNALSMEFDGKHHEMEQTTEFEGEGEFKATIGG